MERPFRWGLAGALLAGSAVALAAAPGSRPAATPAGTLVGASAETPSESPAGTPQAAPDAELEGLRDRLQAALPEVARENVVRSAAPGLFEVRQGSAYGYVTADGRYLVTGDLIDIDSGARLTEQRRNQQRLAGVNALADQAIVFAPVDREVRQWVTVFTDTDCHYCQLLQRELPDINRAGIGVRYLFFSRYGYPSEAYERARTVWCELDRQGVLNRALLSGKAPAIAATACPNPVLAQYRLAGELGIRGTPASVLPDGSLLYGYMKAEEFVAAVREHAAAAPAVPPMREAGPEWAPEAAPASIPSPGPAAAGAD